MLVRKPVGRAAASVKYDLLTAMGAYALAQPKGEQRLVLRIMTLITARYNWARDELAVGQREIARLWHVDERTVKREMAKLRGKGWLVTKRQGARGRVSEYGLDFERIYDTTKANWVDVGPDFDLRMQGAPEEKVVPLPLRGAVSAPDISDGTEWSLTQALVHADDPALYASWVKGLERINRAGSRLVLRAPSRFHAAYVETHLKPMLLMLCQTVDADIAELSLECP